jgi:hypothetical protein
VLTYSINFHIGEHWPCHWRADAQTYCSPDTSAPPKAEQRYVANTTGRPPPITDTLPDISLSNDTLPPDETTAAEEAPGALPAYETTAPTDEQAAKKRRVRLSLRRVILKTNLRADRSTYGRTQSGGTHLPGTTPLPVP